MKSQKTSQVHNTVVIRKNIVIPILKKQIFSINLKYMKFPTTFINNNNKKKKTIDSAFTTKIFKI